MAERFIFCFDPETQIADSLKQSLKGENCKLLTSNHFEEALMMLQGFPIEIAIAPLMPLKSQGNLFLKKVEEYDPNIRRWVLSSSQNIQDALKWILKREADDLLLDPWDENSLKVKILSAFAQYDAMEKQKKQTEKIFSRIEELSDINLSLEEKITERTEALFFYQELIKKIPIPVIGISEEGLIVLSNEALGAAFPELKTIAAGTEMQDVLPPPVVKLIELYLKGMPPKEAMRFTFHKRMARVRIAALKKKRAMRGCVLVLEDL